MRRGSAGILIGVFYFFVMISCTSGDSQESTEAARFQKLESSYTGIDFSNDLEFNREFNIYKYRNFYNGGGVALGDVNNDGLMDIYFTGNQKPNRLYLNEGDFRFKDISESAGIEGGRAWSTGVSMVDINGDGLLDIYVCNSGDVKGDNKQNEFYINNGDLTFTEKAEEMGIADSGYGTHAAFFDYDNDGDLDLYLLNNSYQAIGSFNLQKNERPIRDPEGGDKLFRNDNGNFTDVSEAAGIYGSIIGFGLGVTVGDFDKDGWQDIYVSNDFFERDYIYMNNQDGTFREELEQQMRSISAASMGADYADIDNDGYSEFFVTEMLPEPDSRIKTVTSFETWDKYQLNLKNNYYHQFTRNMLHMNNRNNTYSEVGRLAGVHATDWSWGALIADFDNDGLKDIFVANGIYQDLTNQDYLTFISNEETMKSIITDKGVDYKTLVDVIPSERVPNYMYKNTGTFQFKNVASSWGLDEPSHSNGSAYGDLDNDGDLDLVVNNVNMNAFIYRNNTQGNHFLKVKLVGKELNTFAVGSKVTAYAGEEMFFQEQMPIRGFQSSMDPRIHFGLGASSVVDSLVIVWPDGKKSALSNINADQEVTLSWAEATEGISKVRMDPNGLFQQLDSPIDFVHKENTFVDFDRYRLVFHMRSTEGPASARADVNNDGREDIFIGGAKDSPSTLLIHTQTGKFVPSNQDLFEADKSGEDVDAEFFDADNDGDLDLYVASGGIEYSGTSPALKDRLYFNDGDGNFTKSPQLLPINRFIISSSVSAGDFDGDGDQDLFVGSRMQPLQIGVPVSGYLLENDGSGTFTDISKDKAPGLINLGMIKDGTWSDYDGDGDLDLIVVGEYMPITVFTNENGSLNKTSFKGLEYSEGWWNRIKSVDIDGDGDQDYVVANHGLNSRFKASKEKPITMYVNDFDRNGTIEQIITGYNGDEAYTVGLKQDLVMQMPELKKKYLKFENFVEQTIDQIFTPEQLEGTIELKAYNLRSSLVRNDGDAGFTVMDLPLNAQLSPMFGIESADFDGDGHVDIVMGGNLFNVKPEVGRYDASYGVFLKGDGEGGLDDIPAVESNLDISGEVRDFQLLQIGGKNHLLVIRNNDRPALYQIKDPEEKILLP